MAEREIIALTEGTPQLEAGQSGDTYLLPRDLAMTTGVIESKVADGATAVAFTFDTANALSTSGAKAFSFASNGSEILSFSPYNASLQATELSGEYGWKIEGESGAGTGYTKLYTGDSSTWYEVFTVYRNATFALTPKLRLGGYFSRNDISGPQDGTMTLNSDDDDGATAVGFVFDTEKTFSTSGAKLVSFKNNSTEKAYMDLDGNLVMPNLPTSDPTVAGALWNDSGTLKVSAG